MMIIIMTHSPYIRFDSPIMKGPLHGKTFSELEIALMPSVFLDNEDFLGVNRGRCDF
jgi:hypothetical protein